MTDRELLERAARAAGSSLHINSEGRPVVKGRYWNPLEDDGDAFRLMVALNLNIEFDTVDGGIGVYCHGDYDGGPEQQLEVFERSQEAPAATRRAIVRAAAAMAGES